MDFFFRSSDSQIPHGCGVFFLVASDSPRKRQLAQPLSKSVQNRTEMPFLFLTLVTFQNLLLSPERQD